MVFDANEFFNEHHSEPEEVSLPKRSPNDFSIGELLANHVSVLFVMAGINTDDYTQGVYSSLWNRKLKKEMVRILNAGQDTNVQRIQEKIAEINSYGSSLNNDIEHVDQQPEPESVKDEADNKVGSFKPWHVKDPRDPKPEQVWYVSARYFARNHVKGDPTLLTKRLLLATKVAHSLNAVGIKKRGGIKPLSPSTILKAFNNVILD